MGRYRDDYPSGGASASAAYHYSGALSLPERLHEPSMGAGFGRSLGLLVRDSVYGYDNHVGSWDAGYASVSLASDSSGGGLLSEVHSRTFLGEYGNGSLSTGAQSDWRRPEVDPDVWTSYSRSLYPGVISSTSRTGSHTYGDTHFERRTQPNTLGTVLDPAAESKRKTPSLDTLIKETWELHSLFRAGLAADSKKSKRSTNSTEDTRPRLKKAKQIYSTDDALDTGGKWEDPALVKEETPSSWKELDALPKETSETFSDDKEKDYPLLLDVKQERHASNVQRFTCKKVMQFMDDSSDENDSDDDSFVDSDDDAPHICAESSHNVKSREQQAYEFFLQLFEENEDLQKLYKEQCHVAKFECLVCSSIPGRRPKTYNGLISVIMHANKIIKTKKKHEHRGYARALCSALGWDICRLPTMPPGSSPHPRCCIPTNEEEVVSHRARELQMHWP